MHILQMLIKDNNRNNECDVERLVIDFVSEKKLLNCDQ